MRVLLERDHRGLGLGRTSKGQGCGRRHRGDNLIVEKIEKSTLEKKINNKNKIYIDDANDDDITS